MSVVNSIRSAPILFLRVFSLGCIAAGLSHVALGVGADVLLGATPGAQALSDPTLGSQNRFYGVAFALFGAVTWLATSDLTRYAPVLRLTMIVFFLGGLARLLAWVAQGRPSALAMVLLASELVIPPLVLLWLARQE